jgi:hypothetical protein
MIGMAKESYGSIKFKDRGLSYTIIEDLNSRYIERTPAAERS